MLALGPNKENEEILTISDQKMDTKTEEWAKGPGKNSFLKPKVEGINYTQRF